jgi:hypothetical protein
MKFKDIYLQLEPEMDAAAEIFAADSLQDKG